METRRRLNLLPPQRRQHLRQSVVLASIGLFVRTLLYGSILLTGVGLFALAGLWLSSVTSSSATELALGERLSKYSALRKEIAQHNLMLKKLEEIGQERVVWSNALAQLLDAIPAGMIISDLTVDREDLSLIFTGMALDRNQLVVLEDRLRLLPWVVEVVAPRANLTERTNPTYEFRLVVDPAHIVYPTPQADSVESDHRAGTRAVPARSPDAQHIISETPSPSF